MKFSGVFDMNFIWHDLFYEIFRFVLFKKSIILEGSKEFQHGNIIRYFIWAVASSYLSTTTPKFLWTIIFACNNMCYTNL